MYQPSFEWSEQLEEPAERIGKAVLGLRLFRRTSARNIREWSGFCQPGSFTRPLSRSWPYDTITASALADAEDVAILDVSDVGAFQRFSERLDATIDQADAFASERKLGVVGWFSALGSFQESFGFDRWSDQVPRLIRAIEGALLPEGAGEGVKHRLRQRLCLLLQVDANSSDQLYDDIGHLYDLRSEAEHAADVKEAKLSRRLSSVARSEKRGEGFREWRAIETLRDLARRSIVARIVLATGTDPIWPIGDTESIEKRLLDDGFRAKCREQLSAADGDLGLGLL